LNDFNCDECRDIVLISKDTADSMGDHLPYLFTFYLTRGGLKFVAKVIFDVAQKAIAFFKSHDSAEQILQIQSSSATGVAEQLTQRFCSTTVCKETISVLPQCHQVKLANKLVFYLMNSICKRKLRALNIKLIVKTTVYAGKTALMRTNPMVENRGCYFLS
jgi:hypothetical protein